jgi:hypothetical protein
MTELAGVTLNWAETGIGDDTVGECSLANSWRAVQKDYYGCAGSRTLGPLKQGSIMVSVD